MIYYSKNKIKSFIIFILPCIILLIYLLYFDAFFDFINYTFLGLFDFAANNGVYYFIVFYIILVIYLLYKLVKSRFEDKYLFYVLMFQIVGFPIVDDYHFMIGFIIFLYYILLIKNIKLKNFKYYFIMSFSFFIAFLNNENVKLPDYNLGKITLYDKKESFLYGRNFSYESKKMLNNISKYILDNENNNDNIYLFFNLSYMVKFNMGMNPNKYDLILDGNMGYNGDEEIISLLEDRCGRESCLFIIQFGGAQTNFDIIKYVVFNYDEKDYIDNLINNDIFEIDTRYFIYSNK